MRRRREGKKIAAKPQRLQFIKKSKSMLAERINTKKKGVSKGKIKRMAQHFRS